MTRVDRLTDSTAPTTQSQEQPIARKPYTPPRLRCLGKIAAIGLDPCDCPHYRKTRG